MRSLAIIRFAVLSFLLLAGCDPTPQDQTDSGEAARSPTPAELELDYCIDDCRTAVRDAASRYAVAAAPGIMIAGISTRALDEGYDTIWLATVDFGPTYRPLELVVRYFVSEAGDQYWLATPLTDDLSRALSAVAVQTVIERAIESHEESRDDQSADYGE